MVRVGGSYKGWVGIRQEQTVKGKGKEGQRNEGGRQRKAREGYAD